MKTGDVVAGRYRIEEIAGKGGFHTVFRAIDSILGRRVAVKLLHDYARVKTAHREALLNARVHHSHVVHVYDYDKTPQGEFVIREWVDGASLEDLASRRRLALDELICVLIEVAGAVQSLHDIGIFHRNLK